jgi:hypothetical protein
LLLLLVVLLAVAVVVLSRVTASRGGSPCRNSTASRRTCMQETQWIGLFAK